MSAPLTQLERLAACERLALFYQALDRSDYPACLDCFAPDGSWMRLGKDHVGHEAVARVLEERPAALMVRHLLTNLVARPGADGTAEVSAYVTVHTHKFESGTVTPPGPVKQPIGIYAIQAVMTPAEADPAWRISRLTMAAQFYTPMMKPA